MAEESKTRTLDCLVTVHVTGMDGNQTSGTMLATIQGVPDNAVEAGIKITAERAVISALRSGWLLIVDNGTSVIINADTIKNVTVASVKEVK